MKFFFSTRKNNIFFCLFIEVAIIWLHIILLLQFFTNIFIKKLIYIQHLRMLGISLKFSKLNNNHFN